MNTSHPGFRIFILGAGFSQPAGIPTAIELFDEVCNYIRHRFGMHPKFERDLCNYMTYREACGEGDQSESSVDLEGFMSYLDLEHYLQLRGSDTWSIEGNESQIMIRKAIGHVIHNRTPSKDSLPDVYYRFAERLSLHDVIITFNYDVLLERALDHIGKPYRLFPQRYKTIGHSLNTVDSDIEELVILKLHGSLDWFNNRAFLESRASLSEQAAAKLNLHSVFDDPKRYSAECLVQGPRSSDDPLLHIYRIRDVDGYYLQDRNFHAPYILSPSHVKFVYAEPLLSFWYGMGRSGGYNLGISVIGFSLPQHDEYIRIGLYQMITNYQGSWWDVELLDVLRDYVRFVDYRCSEDSIAEYKSRYSFVEPARTLYMFDGFNNKAIEFLFDQPRQV